MSNVDITQQPPTIISICTGSRGLEKGLAAAIGQEPKIAAYVEIEAFIIENLVKQMEQGLLAPAPVFTDLTQFDGSPFCGRIHGIVGGYPCQGESNAGRRKLWNDPRFLWPHIERLISATDPLFCFFENVSGHLTGSFKYVLASLRELGYTVEAGLYAAEEVGRAQRETFVIDDDTLAEFEIYRRLSHQRKRIFILATKLGNSYCRQYMQPRQEICAGRHAIDLANSELEHAQRDGCPTTTLSPSSPTSDRQEAKGQNATSNASGASGSNSNDAILKELEHTESKRPRELRNTLSTRQGYGLAGRSGILRQDAELANSNRIRHTYQQPKKHPAERGQHAQRNTATGSDEKLVDTSNPRLQGSEQHRTPNTGIEQSKPHGAATEPSKTRGFAVARPGWPQHPWEEPRAIEPSVGCTINGYNFREDLLRMFGNAVQEHQCTHAYAQLWHKHFGN